MNGAAELAGEADLGALAHSLGFLLRMAQIGEFERFFEAFGDTGLTPGAFSALMVVGRNPGIRHGALGRALRIKPAHMTKLLRAMDERGLLERSVPDGDRRAVELALSPAGRAFVDRHLARFRAHEAKIPPRLEARERDELVRLLRKMNGLPTDGKKP